MLSVALGAGRASSAASWASVMTWLPEYCSERIPGSRSRGQAQPDSFCVSVPGRTWPPFSTRARRYSWWLQTCTISRFICGCPERESQVSLLPSGNVSRALEGGQSESWTSGQMGFWGRNHAVRCGPCWNRHAGLLSFLAGLHVAGDAKKNKMRFLLPRPR